jgi:electron transport complex protein RnfD
MLDTLIALLPAFVWGCVAFGVRALTIALISVGVALASEILVCLVMRKKVTASDLSAVVTGLIVAMCLPVNVPLWMPAVGSLFAIVVVKQCFGGLGKNIFNPAAAAVVLLSVGERAISYFAKTSPGAFYDVESKIPLDVLKAGVLPSDSILDLVIGNCAGAIGEVSSLLLVAGGVYLLIRRVISWRIPVSFIGTVALVTLVFPNYNGVAAEFMIYELLSGALILAAFFMATDPATSPVTDLGKIIFGIGCGLITVLIRYFGMSSEGVMYAILLMNLTVPLIEKITRQKSLGK